MFPILVEEEEKTTKESCVPLRGTGFGGRGRM